MYDKVKDIISANETVVAFVAATSTCMTCQEWVPSVLKAACAKFDVSVNIIYVDKEFVPLPPAHSPTTYFYVNGVDQPMIILGPEFREQIDERLKTCFAELERLKDGNLTSSSI
jgi:hypothetical protein